MNLLVRAQSHSLDFSSSSYDRLGPDRYIDIIDCEKQVTYKMSLEEYIEYFESIDRNKIYNVLSLEISSTKYVECQRADLRGSSRLTASFVRSGWENK